MDFDPEESLESAWRAVAGAGVGDLQGRRVTVLQLHVSELTKQGRQREQDLREALALIRENDSQRAAHAPMERKLFAKLESLHAALRIEQQKCIALEKCTTTAEQTVERQVYGTVVRGAVRARLTEHIRPHPV